MARCTNNPISSWFVKTTVIPIDLRCKITLVLISFTFLVYMVTTISLRANISSDPISTVKDVSYKLPHPIFISNSTCATSDLLPDTLNRVGDMALLLIDQYTLHNEGDPWIATSYNSSKFGDFLPNIRTTQLSIAGLSKLYRLGQICIANSIDNRIRLAIVICVDEITFVNEGYIGPKMIRITGNLQYLIMRLVISIDNQGGDHPNLDYFEIVSMNRVRVVSFTGLGPFNTVAEIGLNYYTRNNEANITERISNVIENHVVRRNLLKVSAPTFPCKISVSSLFPLVYENRPARANLMAVKNHVCSL